MTDAFKLLFLTDFQDPSYRVIPAISHLAAEIKTSLTILHVYRHADEREAAECDVRSFFAEAEHYAGCRRIAAQAEGNLDAVALVAQYCRTARPDLIIAPSGDRAAPAKFLRPSFRGQLLESIDAPLWTFTARCGERRCFGPTRRIACYVDFEFENINHLAAAVDLSTRLDATLQLLHVVPDISESSLGIGWHTDRPLHTDVAERRLRRLLNPFDRRVEVYVGVGAEETELPRLLDQCRSDLVFVGEGQALGRSLLGKAAVRSIVKRSPCPVICMDGKGKSGARWDFGVPAEDYPRIQSPVLVDLSR